MKIGKASGSVTVESRLLAEMNEAAAAYMQSRGKTRQVLLRRYFTALHKLTDEVLAELEAQGVGVDGSRMRRVRCEPTRNRQALSTPA